MADKEPADGEAATPYLPLFLRARGERACVVGGGLVAARRVETLARAGALATVYAASLDEEEFAPLRERFAFTQVAREPTRADLSGALLCYIATGDGRGRRRLHAELAGAGPPISVADRPDLSDFHLALDSRPLAAGRRRLHRRRFADARPHAAGAVGDADPRRLRPARRLRRPHRARLSTTSCIRRSRGGASGSASLDGPIAELVLARNEPAAEAAFEEALDRAAEGGEDPPLGEVYLVGAGPGDADLLTFRALRLMQKADVVLYDRLVDPGIVDLARREAERIYVGKRRDDHALPQEEISDMLVRLAREGKRVLRLKGGDPFIFGRGGEEIERLAEHGVPFQVCPGVTAATACAAYAGIPLTHRDHAQACVFVTGHGRDGPLDLDWETLAQAQPDSRDLHGARPARGADAGPSSPTAPSPPCPRRSSTTARASNQRVVVGTLADLAAKARAANLRGPDDRHRRHGRVAAR